MAWAIPPTVQAAMEEGWGQPSEHLQFQLHTPPRWGRNGGGLGSALGAINDSRRKAGVTAAMEEGWGQPSEHGLPRRMGYRQVPSLAAMEEGWGQPSEFDQPRRLKAPPPVQAAMEEGWGQPSEMTFMSTSEGRGGVRTAAMEEGWGQPSESRRNRATSAPPHEKLRPQWRRAGVSPRSFAIPHRMSRRSSVSAAMEEGWGQPSEGLVYRTGDRHPIRQPQWRRAGVSPRRRQA